MVGNNQAKENWIGVGSEILSVNDSYSYEEVNKKKKFKQNFNLRTEEQNFYLRTESVVHELNRHG